MSEYIFTSERLGFRNWMHSDLDAFAAMNADSEVMAHFPKKLTKKESVSFIDRMINHFDTYGYTYYAVDILSTSEFSGFIGLCNQDYEAPFNPSVDIGWRLHRNAWGNGYATEGAKSCINYAFTHLNIPRITSVCPITNTSSENVMIKSGMYKKGEFYHPKLGDYPRLQKCVWYEIEP